MSGPAENASVLVEDGGESWIGLTRRTGNSGWRTTGTIHRAASGMGEGVRGRRRPIAWRPVPEHARSPGASAIGGAPAIGYHAAAAPHHGPSQNRCCACESPVVAAGQRDIGHGVKEIRASHVAERRPLSRCVPGARRRRDVPSGSGRASGAPPAFFLPVPRIRLCDWAHRFAVRHRGVNDRHPEQRGVA